MIKINGNVSDAVVYTDVVEQEAIDQIKNLCDYDFTKGSTIRVMPDVHVGKGCTIGFTMTITDKVVPNLVGVDIGCGMETVEVSNKNIELEKFDKMIYAKIPYDKDIRTTAHRFADEIDLSMLRCSKNANLNINRAYKSIGSLGGGNHFIEIGKDELGKMFITVHSGSRNLGKQVATYYQELAYQKLNKYSKKDIQDKIMELKNQNRESEIETEIKKMKEYNMTSIPYELAYLENEFMEDYLHDMKIVQEFARLNRLAIMDELVNGMKLKIDDSFTTIHNYIDTKSNILRKGAVSAQKDEKILIPINMRDGALICKGKGNPDWNYSAPHGAGRLKSRIQAKNTFTLSEFKKQMQGIYTTTISAHTLDECPMAYKPMESIIDNVSGTVEIVKQIKPIYNFKG